MSEIPSPIETQPSKASRVAEKIGKFIESQTPHAHAERAMKLYDKIGAKMSPDQQEKMSNWRPDAEKWARGIGIGVTTAEIIGATTVAFLGGREVMRTAKGLKKATDAIALDKKEGYVYRVTLPETIQLGKDVAKKIGENIGKRISVLYPKSGLTQQPIQVDDSKVLGIRHIFDTINQQQRAVRNQSKIK